MRLLVIQALNSDSEQSAVTVKGWVRTRRDSKTFSFLEINDGTCLPSLQCVVDSNTPGYENIARVTTGASVALTGNLIPSLGKNQKWELQATGLELLGESPESYPLQKKGHSLDFLRSIAHLRARTNLFGAVFRTRSLMAGAIHRFFQERFFTYIHTPLITASDCEGAGEMFRVTTLDPFHNKAKSYEEDFFGKAAFLTVSGQLEGETMACALTNIYTFGPTFRAENSNTARHAAEFWMVEPEMAFADLKDDMDMAEACVKYLVREMLEKGGADLEFFNNFVDKTLKERLEFVAERSFVRLPYDEAVAILLASGKKFEYPVESGQALQSEHERYLTEQHFKSPVTVYNYPKEIKPFYMRLNDDNRTVTAMDVLVPGIGEIVGGSQREERLDVLLDNMKRLGLNEEDYSWYVDLRRFGTVPHAGFGMGFERILMFVTGVSNIRDVIPYARTPKNCAF